MEAQAREIPGRGRTAAGSWPRSGAITTASLAVIVLAGIYLLTPTSDYFWDGITFALQIEKVASGQRSARLLFHQNHLLYNVVGYVCYRLSQMLGAGLRPLPVLQLANAAFGAFGAAILAQIAGQVTGNKRIGVFAGIALGFSAVWWKLATDADAYILAVLLVLVCARNLLGPRPRWYAAGATLAGAMLIHQLASLFFVAAAAGCLLNQRIERKRRFTALMSLAAWGPVVSIYCVCAFIFAHITNPRDLLSWATSNPSLIKPSANPVPGIWLTPRVTLDLFVGHAFTFVRGNGQIAAIAVVAAALAGGGFLLTGWRTVRNGAVLESLSRAPSELRVALRPAIGMSLTWVAVYLIFLCFFEPQDPNLRLFYAPALVLLVAIVLRLLDERAPRDGRGGSRIGAPVIQCAILAIATLALFNLVFFISPLMRTQCNPVVAAARSANRVWDDRTVVYFADRNEADTTFEYFNEKTEWRRLSSAALGSLDREVWDVLAHGGNVWLNRGATRLVGPEWLARYNFGEELKADVPYATAHYVQLLTPTPQD